LLDGTLTNGINLQVGIGADDNSKINLAASLFAKADSTTLLGEATITGDGKGNIQTFTDTVAGDSSAANHTAAKIGDDYFKYDATNKTLTAMTTAEATTAKSHFDAQAVANPTYIAKSSDELKFKTGALTDATANLDNMFKNDVTAQSFLDNVDTALANVTARKTAIGATQQRITSAMEVSEVMSTNLTSASSLIKEADIAKESSNYIKNQILQKTASTLLATANQNPSIALSLV